MILVQFAVNWKRVALIFLLAALCGSAFSALDKTKYITVDEIRPDMDAYCLTVLKGTKIEKFEMKVVSVVHNSRPGQDRILVMCLDERFIHAGAIHGCSGSPVYIDGRMAGAMSAGWDASKDPLYLVTPIADMLDVGKYKPSKADLPVDGALMFGFDYSKPLSIDEISRQFEEGCLSLKGRGAGQLLPLTTSFSPEVCEYLAGQLQPFGFVPVSAAGAGGSDLTGSEDVVFEPGSVLAIPMVSGDISMAGVGTVTEVVGNKVYGFGHSMMGYGPVDLPMASGKVHTVVANILVGSFKLTTPGPIRGAIRADESAAVFGLTDKVANLIPVRIHVDKFNDRKKRTYNCKVLVNRNYTPMMLRSVIAGTGFMKGLLPPEHTVRYSAKIGVKGFEAIEFENVSSGPGLMEFIGEVSGTVGMLMNNPYGKIEIESIDLDMKVLPRNTRAVIDSVKLADSKVKAGETVDVTVVLQSYLSYRKVKRLKLTIPKDTKPGQHDLLIVGGYEYEKLMSKLVPHKFTARDVPSLVSSLKNVLANRRDRLYLVMELPADGITIENSELAFLPGTKALLLKDPKRTMDIKPYNTWIEDGVSTEWITLGKKTIKITVEE